MFARVSACTCVFVSPDRKSLCEHEKDVFTQHEGTHTSPARLQMCNRSRGGSDLTTQQPSCAALGPGFVRPGGRPQPPQRHSGLQLQLNQKYGAGVYQHCHSCNSILRLHMDLGKVSMETAAVNQPFPSVLLLLT